MKREAKRAMKALEQAGYQMSHRNGKGFFVFRRGRKEVAVNPSMSERAERDLLRSLGSGPSRGKRSSARAKQKRSAERQRAADEVARIERERERILAERDARLDGAASMLTAAEERAIEKRIEELDREHSRWRALMTEAPSATPQRVKHRTGASS